MKVLGLRIFSKIFHWIKAWKFSDWLFAAVLIFFIVTKVPSLLEQQGLQGTKLVPIVLDGKTYPIPEQKSVLIFWASWCGPCTIELNRIQKAINEKEISATNLFAVNIGEEENNVNKVVMERKYSMPIIFDKFGALANKLNVQGTPTIAFIDESGRVDWLSSGISPTLIYKIKRFQNK